MSGRIAHRGPDGSGIWEDPLGRACFAHRRLSIIDLASGQQPMASEDAEYQIVFNGEIYNYLELGRELNPSGPALRTHSDTEILLRLLIERELDALPLLHGMFAFAVYDSRRHRLLAARDRMGKKPFFYTTSDGVLYFASTFDALQRAGLGQAEPDVAAVDEFLELGYIPAPLSIDPQIAKLPAAAALRAECGKVTTVPFWSPGGAPVTFAGSFEDAVDHLDDLLTSAVDIRLRSDVPLGVFLSGGIDSSLIAAIAARRSASGLRTFSVGFDDEQFDESQYAAEVGRRIGSEHQTFHTRYDALGLLPELVRHFGEPFGDSSAIPTWQLARETRRYVTVALGGDGGDEGFGGYNWYRTALRLKRMSRIIPASAASMLGRFGGAAGKFTGSGRFARTAAMLALNDSGRFAALRTFVDPPEAHRLYAGALAALRIRSGSHARSRLAELYCASSGSGLRAMREVDITTYLADDLLPKVDVATMAHGLECRAPLLDHRVVEFALSLPDAWITDERQGKHLLRSLLARYLPLRLFDRPKQGFSVPLVRWFAGELQPLVAGLPRSAPLLDTGWFQPGGIRSIIEEHAAGRRNHSQRIFNLLVLEEWLRQR